MQSLGLSQAWSLVFIGYGFGLEGSAEDFAWLVAIWESEFIFLDGSLSYA